MFDGKQRQLIKKEKSKSFNFIIFLPIYTVYIYIYIYVQYTLFVIGLIQSFVIMTKIQKVIIQYSIQCIPPCENMFTLIKVLFCFVPIYKNSKTPHTVRLINNNNFKKLPACGVCSTVKKSITKVFNFVYTVIVVINKIQRIFLQ